jgi:hypothetical protein
VDNSAPKLFLPELTDNCPSSSGIAKYIRQQVNKVIVLNASGLVQGKINASFCWYPRIRDREGVEVRITDDLKQSGIRENLISLLDFQGPE